MGWGQNSPTHPHTYTMAGRPWYAQAADMAHRLTVLGILGFSGYLCVNIGSAIRHNHQTKQRERLLSKEVAELESESESRN